MTLRINFLFWLCIISSFSFASLQVDFSDIPEDLEKDANAIIRYKNEEFEVKSNDVGYYTIKFAVTVLNQNGNKFANLAIFYDKFREIKAINGRIYNKYGKVIEKIKFKDFYDQSITPDGSLYDDNRVKYFEVFQNNYPYTVEYEYTIKYNGFISFPTWNPIYNYKLAVENANFQLTTDTSYSLHYKALNYNKEPDVDIIDNIKTYTWSVSNVNALTEELLSPAISEITPVVHSVPDQFFLDKTIGKQDSWTNYGKWAFKLLEERDELTDQTKEEVHALTKNIDDEKLKTRLIYEYMQSKTRYVSIQLGIGGFQPANAIDVDNLGYGDCKALTNYTKALLNEVGIESIYAEVFGGYSKNVFLHDFPGTTQTNHIILCVPLKKDTIWLECTDQHQPFGYLGKFTDDRYAVLITSDGGKLAKTTKYTKKENTQSRFIAAQITSEGNLNAEIHTEYIGLQYDNISHQFKESKEDQRKNLFKTLDINNFTIKSFEYNQVKDAIPYATESIEITADNYCTLTGKRMFLPLNLMNKHTYIPKEHNNRETEVVLKNSYIEVDSIVYHIPDNYTIEYLPEDKNIVTRYGEYESIISVKNEKLIYIRKFGLNKGRYSPESYGELIDFFKELNKTDNQKAILIEATEE